MHLVAFRVITWSHKPFSNYFCLKYLHFPSEFSYFKWNMAGCIEVDLNLLYTNTCIGAVVVWCKFLKSGFVAFIDGACRTARLYFVRQISHKKSLFRLEITKIEVHMLPRSSWSSFSGEFSLRAPARVATRTSRKTWPSFSEIKTRVFFDPSHCLAATRGLLIFYIFEDEFIESVLGRK